MTLSGLTLPPKHGFIVLTKMMLALGQPVSITVKCIRDPGSIFYPLIYSSSNHFEIRANRDEYINLPDAVFPGIRIYYRSPDALDGWTAL